jgi:hypothetical protein
MGDCCGLVDVDLVVELLAQASSTFQHSHQVGSPRELRKTTCSSWGCQVIGLHYTQLHNSPQGCISSQDVGGQERLVAAAQEDHHPPYHIRTAPDTATRSQHRLRMGCRTNRLKPLCSEASRDST